MRFLWKPGALCHCPHSNQTLIPGLTVPVVLSPEVAEPYGQAPGLKKQKWSSVKNVTSLAVFTCRINPSLGQPSPWDIDAPLLAPFP